MVKVVLSFWYKGNAPGDQIEVPEHEYKQMVRDGRVASVVKEEPAKSVQAKPAVPENKVADPKVK